METILGGTSTSHTPAIVGVGEVTIGIGLVMVGEGVATVGVGLVTVGETVCTVGVTNSPKQVLPEASNLARRTPQKPAPRLGVYPVTTSEAVHQFYSDISF
jgi:hypothetical protein